MLRPAAEVLFVMLRVPLNPRILLTVIVAVALEDGPERVTMYGLGERAKSGPGIEHIVKEEATAGLTLEAAAVGLCAEYTRVLEKNTMRSKTILSFKMLFTEETVQDLLLLYRTVPKERGPRF